MQGRALYVVTRIEESVIGGSDPAICIAASANLSLATMRDPFFRRNFDVGLALLGLLCLLSCVSGFSLDAGLVLYGPEGGCGRVQKRDEGSDLLDRSVLASSMWAYVGLDCPALAVRLRHFARILHVFLLRSASHLSTCFRSQPSEFETSLWTHSQFKNKGDVSR